MAPDSLPTLEAASRTLWLASQAVTRYGQESWLVEFKFSRLAGTGGCLAYHRRLIVANDLTLSV